MSTSLRRILSLALAIVALPALANAQCPPDSFEPNESCGSAVPIGSGFFPGLGVDPFSEDWYAILLAPGDAVQVDVFFQHIDGDVDAQLRDISNCGVSLVSAGSTTDNEQVAYTNNTGAPRQLAIRVFLFNAPICTQYDLSVAIMPGQVCPADALEPNDSCATAAPIAPGTTSGLNIDVGLLDWYTITVAAGDMIQVDLTFLHAQGDIDLRLEAPCGTFRSSATSVTDNESASWTNTTGVSQDVKIRANRFGTAACTPYSITVGITTPPTCVPDAFEPNETCATASPIVVGTTTGLNIDPGTLDFYSINLAAGDAIQVDLTFLQAQGDIDLRLEAPCGTTRASSTSVTDNESASWTNTTGVAQLVVIRANRFGAALCTPYSLTIVTTTPPVCVDDDAGANDTCATPQAVVVGATTATVRDVSPDWYTLAVAPGATLLVDANFVHASGDVDLELLGACTTPLDASGTTTNNEHLEWVNTTGATAQVQWRVFLFSGTCNDYQMIVGITPPACLSDSGSQFVIPAGQGMVVPPVPVAGDRMGSSIAVSNDTVAVGGVGVWVFRAGMTGNLAFEQRLFTPDQTSDFGTAVDIDGDLLVATDLGDSELGINAKARVFRRTGSTWALEATLPPGGVPPYNGYGLSVAISGVVVVVAAPWTGTNHGLVHVFSRESGSWQQIALLSKANPQPNDRFGADVDIDGETIVVGAPGTRAGAWIYQRLPNPNFTLAYTFSENDSVSPGPQPGGVNLTGFGESVAIDDGTILIGRPFDSAGGVNSGAISVYLRPGAATDWNFATRVDPCNALGGEFLGGELAISGDRALVAAPFGSGGGAVFVLKRNLGGAWEQETKLVPGGAGPNDLFGSAVAIDGPRLAVGAPQNSAAESWAGAVYSVVAPPMFPLATDAFCFGDGGDGQGCTDCPCGNNAPAGTVGGCLHSSGQSAVLASMGNASVSNDTLRFEVHRALANTFALLISGTSRTPLAGGPPCPPGSGVTSVALDGLRCVAMNVVRHGARASDLAGSIGVTNPGWGPPSGPPGGLVLQGGFVAGQTRYFQTFYRDPPAQGCGTGLNTTNAVATTIAP